VAELPSDVLAFHREIPVLDLHIDTLLWMRLFGYDIGKRHGNPLPRAAFFSHLDLPRAAEAGLDGAVFGLVVNPVRVEPELMRPLRILARLERGCGTEQTLATLDLLAAAERRHPERLAFARSGTEMREAIASGRFAALPCLEGAHGIEDRLENVHTAYASGLRMIGLVHFQRSAAAWPMTVPDFADRGLTPFGFELIAEMESLGMVVDLAHVNPPGIDDALGAMTRPFVVSHTACRGVHDDPRNLDDDTIRRIAERGGVIGLAVGRSLFGSSTLERYLDQLEHALRVGGEDAVAIGSDWDGAIVPAAGMEDVRSLPHVTHELLLRGWSQQVVRKVMGENILRVLTEVCG
jgi:membrane dipeptidase